jgi:tetraacyldisaccharide-1-P 4'-kinase
VENERVDWLLWILLVASIIFAVYAAIRHKRMRE